MHFNNPYPCAESPEWTAVCMFRGIRYVEIMAAGARSKIEVFSCVDPVSPIRVISRWFHDIGFAFKRYETPAERGRRAWKDLSELRRGATSYLFIYFSRIQILELH